MYLSTPEEIEDFKQKFKTVPHITAVRCVKKSYDQLLVGYTIDVLFHYSNADVVIKALLNIVNRINAPIDVYVGLAVVTIDVWQRDAHLLQDLFTETM